MSRSGTDFMKPRVTFLLPVHNQAGTVAETIASVLEQTERNFELVIIDDASTDDTPKVLRGQGDPRIRIFRNAERLELARSLNVGLQHARAPYIARIDGDDLCLPQRAAVQAAFLDGHGGVGVVGAFLELFGSEQGGAGGAGGRRIFYPTEPAAVAAATLMRNPLAHPAVMMRRSALEQHGLRYNETFRRGQDYALWAACVVKGVRLANVPEVLVRYREHPAQASRTEVRGVRETGERVRRGLIEALGLQPSEADMAVHEALCWDELQPEAAWLARAGDWLNLLAGANARRPVFDAEALGRVLCGRWVRVLRASKECSQPLRIAGAPLLAYLEPAAAEEFDRQMR